MFSPSSLMVRKKDMFLLFIVGRVQHLSMLILPIIVSDHPPLLSGTKTSMSKSK